MSAVCIDRTAKPPLGTPRKIGQGCKFHSFTTNTYKMHFLESPSGIKVGSVSSGLPFGMCQCLVLGEARC